MSIHRPPLAWPLSILNNSVMGTNRTTELPKPVQRHPPHQPRTTEMCRGDTPRWGCTRPPEEATAVQLVVTPSAHPLAMRCSRGAIQTSAVPALSEGPGCAGCRRCWWEGWARPSCVSSRCQPRTWPVAPSRGPGRSRRPAPRTSRLAARCARCCHTTRCEARHQLPIRALGFSPVRRQARGREVGGHALDCLADIKAVCGACTWPIGCFPHPHNRGWGA
jgi:hypothetical protein